MSEQNYYDLLGVSKQASNQEIRKAYRRLAMKYHPDRSSGDKANEEKFKQVKKAYEVLSDSQQRAAYDQVGHSQYKSASRGGRQSSAGAGMHGFEDMFGSIFDDFFNAGGGGRGQRQANRGADLEYVIELTLEEAAFGTEKNIKVASMQSCDACKGSGAEAGSSKVTCITCNGVGQVRMQQGFFSIQQTCPDCRGAGERIEKVCRSCNGAGRQRKSRVLAVKIPSGIDESKHIRLSGEGEAGGGGGPSGDLYVRAHIKPHELFERVDNNLLVRMPINFVTATLGGEIEVPSLGNRLKLKVPSGTQSGKRFRIRGKGIVSLQGSTGDLVCEVIVETPVNLTDEQKKLLGEFDSLVSSSKQRHSPNEQGWGNTIRKFLDGLK